MKKLLILSAIGLVILLVIGLVLFVSFRQQQLTGSDSTPSLREWLSTDDDQRVRPTSNIKLDDQGVPRIADVTTAEGQELYNTTVIKRGNLVSLDSTRQQLTITDDFSVDKATVVASYADLVVVSCWPEVIANQNGSQSLLRDSYIPFAPEQPLVWSGQTEKAIEQVVPTLDSSSYLFLRLVAPYDSTNTDTQHLRQLVVLGC